MEELKSKVAQQHDHEAFMHDLAASKLLPPSSGKASPNESILISAESAHSETNPSNPVEPDQVAADHSPLGSAEMELLSKALRIAGSPSKLSQWVNTPLPGLGGRTPYSAMQSEAGLREVDAILDRIDHGVY